MSEIYLASSALKAEGFEGQRTIEEAQKGFAGVQLFLDIRYRNKAYRAETIQKLQASSLGLVLHLPDTVSEEDVTAAEDIVANFPNARVLIHYLPATEAPKINGTHVGWENSMVGPIDQTMQDHIKAVDAKVKGDNSFWVYDMGRLLYAPKDKIEETKAYISAKIKSLDPAKDIIHLSDKTSWTLRFRECACIVGEGVMGDLIEDVRAYKGVVVFEYEDLEMAMASLPRLSNN